MQLPSIESLEISGKKVLVRADLDVPIENGTVIDDTRLTASLPTLHYLLDHSATVIVAGHLGRPDSSKNSEENQEYSLEPVAKWYENKLNVKSQKLKVGDFDAWQVTDRFFLLENLRFYPGEEENSEEFARKLAALANMYVNDAFAVSHRNHASIVGVATLLPHAAGFRLTQEVSHLEKVLENPERPLVVIIGGAKIETKLPLIEKMHQMADFVLVGGKLASETTTLLKVAHEKVENRKSVLLVGKLTGDTKNITQESVEEFKNIIKDARTVIWNGPLGIDGEVSVQIAQAVIATKAYSVVGGGDTIEVLDAADLTNKFSFVSTGGGAMLSLLSGEELPGLEVLK